MRRLTGLMAAVSILVQMSVTAKADEPLLRNPVASVRQFAPAMSCAELASQKLISRAAIVDTTLQREKSGLEWCQVTAVVRSIGSQNQVKIWIGLPIRDWNGRLLGTSGGGYLGGSPSALGGAIEAGFVAVATDAGHAYSAGNEEAAVFDGSFAIDSEGNLNRDSVRNFAHVGIHEMTITAKETARVFYGTPPAYSYFAGCSTVGRQGQSEVQRYPDDYDGVLSGAPAINWAHFLPAAMWAKVVMNESHRVVGQCKLEVARQASIDYCDKRDGVSDGVIGRPDLCRFSAKTLVGKKTPCGEIDTTDAAIIDKIWDGPRAGDGRRLWFGLPYGATFDFDTGGDPRGASAFDGAPSPIAVGWFKFFLLHDPKWSPDSLDRPTFERLFKQSIDEYGEVFDTSSSDLGAFYARGGKTIIWHGLADSNFPAEGTLKYVDEIRKRLGAQQTEKFLRLYVAPSVGHCGGGDGPQPIGLLDALIDWVEHSKTPETIAGEIRNSDGKLKSAWALTPYRGIRTQSLALPR